MSDLRFLAKNSLGLEDLRKASRKLARVPNYRFVRVSDDWWVIMKDGKPEGYVPHNEFMVVIERHSVADRPGGAS